MYKKVLNSEFADDIAMNDLSWLDSLLLFVERAGISKKTIEDMELDCVAVPDPEKIRKWYVENIGAVQRAKKQSPRLVYHGINISGKALADASGYSLNTIYAYWQKSMKNTETFSKMIDKRLTTEQKTELLSQYEPSEEDISEEFEILC